MKRKNPFNYCADCRTHGDEAGIALFFVLWVLVLLSVITGEFCRTMRNEVNITRSYKDATQAFYIARAGFNIAVSELIKKPEEKIGKNVFSKVDPVEDPVIDWRVNTDLPEIEFAQGRFKVQLGNDSGRIDINKAGRFLFTILLNGIDLDDYEKSVIIDSIFDWRDKDSIQHANGAEDDYYLSLDNPYPCGNGDFKSIEELMLVRGVDEKLFNETLKERITVSPNERGLIFRGGNFNSENKEAFDYDKINLNAAPPGVLKAFPLMTDAAVQAIIDYRQEKDFTSILELASVVPKAVFGGASPYLTLKYLPLFTMKSTGMVDGDNVKNEIQARLRVDSKLEMGYEIIQWLQ
ncbi:GspK2 [Desulforapulum autotrophicum HRM2]|uniref:GspK2 n=1 Tax=Desulforapulum autotrophicum (strain ATCC 43914 / DSM 3382 / VKM B-1955 / HRM2) TaxID=177437 RepID=C0QK72_DESAH|nr:type II secretion system protein GspK [Desulforapulum autotrophicum]ACN16098.1 GspK2 [Desulforapulum autotrophicum HRM2]